MISVQYYYVSIFCRPAEQSPPPLLTLFASALGTGGSEGESVKERLIGALLPLAAHGR